MIPFPHSRFEPPTSRDEQFQDVPWVTCRECSARFEQHDPDDEYCMWCEDERRTCRMCGEQFQRKLTNHCCDRCNQLPEPQPNNQTMKDYLGDSVYAEWDGYHIVLTTNNGYLDDPRNTIALDPMVLTALKNFEQRVTEHCVELRKQEGAEQR